jgi:hypothetical protein
MLVTALTSGCSAGPSPPLDKPIWGSTAIPCPESTSRRHLCGTRGEDASPQICLKRMGKLVGP